MSTCITTYNVGASVRLTATFTDTGGVAADPSSVVFIYLPPSSTSVTVSSTATNNPSVGTWYTDVDADKAGTWRYRVQSTGTLVSAREGWFRVLASGVST